MLKYFKLCTGLLWLATVLVVQAEDHASRGVESLSPELRLLLSKEMNAIQQGIMAVVPAFASGDNRQVALIAKNIKDSYILAQSLTTEQKHELQTRLSADFFKLDEKFHYYAGMLEHAAAAKKPELIGFYLAKLTESCAACHVEHARQRFPNFEKPQEEHEHSH